MSMRILLLLCFISGFRAQNIFTIGFLNDNVLNYMKSYTNSSKFSFEPVRFTDGFYNNVNAFDLEKRNLRNLHAIIGLFDYRVATLCASMPLAYFVIDEQITRNSFTRPLLDFSLDVKLLGGALNMILNTYNWISNVTFISDSSPYAMDILQSISDGNINQINFNPTDNNSIIEESYNRLKLSNSPGKAYVVVSNDADTNLIDRIMTQMIYRSLTYQSFVFFPMLKTNAIVLKYRYSGGMLFSIKITANESESTSSFMNTSAVESFNRINQTVEGNRLSSTTNQSSMLQLLLSIDSSFDSQGARNQYFFYWTALQKSNLSISLMSFIRYSAMGYELPVNLPDPTNLVAIDVVKSLYYVDPVFVFDTLNPDGTRKFGGYLVDSLNLLLLPLKLSYSLQAQFSVDIIGRYNKTSSTYSGLLGEMAKNTADMIAFPIPIVTSYFNRFVYSTKVVDISYSILISKRKSGFDIYRLVKPYSPVVWVVILVLIVFLSIILWLINFISPNISDGNDKLTVNNSIFMVIGSFLIAKMLVKPNMISTQIFYLLIWLTALLLIASYVANLSVSIAFQTNQSISFSTLPDLLNQTAIKWVFLENSFLHNQIMDDNDTGVNSVVLQLYKYAREHWSDNFLLNNTVDIPSFLISNPDYGLLNDEYHNLFFSLSNCSFVTLVDTTTNVSLAYLFQPNFKYLREVNQRIISMEAAGIIDNLETRSFLIGLCPSTASVVSNILPLGITEMGGAFILICFGIIISLPASLIEFILSKTKLQCQRNTTGNSLKFGQIYSAKVKALDKNGVTVDIGRLNICSKTNEGRIYYVPKKYLGVKRKGGDKEILGPTDQGIMIGTKLLLKYMGNNPVDSKRIFVQVQKR